MRLKIGQLFADKRTGHMAEVIGLPELKHNYVTLLKNDAEHCIVLKSWLLANYVYLG